MTLNSPLKRVLQPDARDGDAGRFIAYLSHRPAYAKLCETQVYGFVYENAGHLKRDAVLYKPANGWEKSCPVIPGLYADNMKVIAPSTAWENPEALITYARAWYASFTTEGMEVAQYGTPLTLVGKWWDPLTRSVLAPEGVRMSEKLRQTIIFDYVLLVIKNELQAAGKSTLGCIRQWDFKRNGKKFIIQHKLDTPQEINLEKRPELVTIEKRAELPNYDEFDSIATENIDHGLEYNAFKNSGISYNPVDYDNVLSIEDY